LGFLDEGVQDQNDVANGGAEQRPANALFAFGTYLK
jgi:hypothetical protein